MTENLRTKNRMAIAGALFAASILAGCSRTESAGKEELTSQTPSNPMEIRTKESLEERLKIGEPTWTQVGGGLTVAARVQVDETRVAHVGASVMGRIIELDIREGQEVTRGQLLAVLNSPGLADAQRGLLKALSQVQLAQRSVERAEQLLNAGVIGSAELRRREAELTQAANEVVVDREQLKILGMAEDSIVSLEKTRTISSFSRVMAPMDGTVLRREVAMGQVIQPADTLAEIADLTHLWVVADVPERDAGTMRVGLDTEVKIAAFPGEIIRGRLSFVSATVNPDTRTVRVRLDLANPQKRFKPAMLATMVLKDPAQRKLTIPASAVVRDGDQEYVFVRTSEDKFVLRPVTLGGEPGETRVLIDGVKPGEQIVVDGAFHLNNERIRLTMQGE